ncbi:MAG: hypothetical protein Q9183_003604, partial [Haloplaca sp. 2 TL-2023]
ASTFLPMNPVVRESDYRDQISETATQTSHGSTSSVQQHTLTIPPPPQSSLEGLDFECPYCYTICRLVTAEPWQQRREWRQHVLWDLQPYVCTFGGCSEANTLYERRRDWIAHELQSHRNEWCCNVSGHQPYDNRNDFKGHMIREHLGSFDTDGLDALSDMVARPAVNMKFSCPLNCAESPSNLTIDRLERHLGRHLEVIATFALPSRGTETPQSYGSNVTRDVNASGSASRGSMQSISDDDVSAFHAEDDGQLSLQDTRVGSSNGSQETYKDIQDCINDLISDLESSYPQPLPAWFLAKSVEVVNDQLTWIEQLDDSAPLWITIPLQPIDPYKSIGQVFRWVLLEAESKIRSSQPQHRTGDDSQFVRPGYQSLMYQALLGVATALMSESRRSISDDLTEDLLLGLEILYDKVAQLLQSSRSMAEASGDWNFLHEEARNTSAKQLSSETLMDIIMHSSLAQRQSNILDSLLDWRHPDTLNWFFESQPSTIVQELRKQSTRCVYYFFQESTPSFNTLDNTIRSLLWQLGTQSPEMPVNAQSLLTNWRDNGTEPSLDQLHGLVLMFLSESEETTIVLDGLDLVDEHIIKALARIVESAIVHGFKVQLLVASRISSVVEDAIRFAPQDLHRKGLEWQRQFRSAIIPRQAVNKDIVNYLFWRSSRSSDLSPAIPNLTSKVLLDFNGIWFTYTLFGSERFVNLLSQFNEASQNRVWTAILTRVKAQASDTDFVNIKDILHTLTVCERNLNSSEIYESLSCGGSTSGWVRPPYSDCHKIWRLLPALLELVAQPHPDGSFDYYWQNHLGLIHASLRAFLQSPEIQQGPLACFAVNEVKARRSITKKCIANLTEYRRSDLYRSKYGWTAYAGTYWHKHVKKLELAGKPAPPCSDLLSSSAPSFPHWTYMTRRDGDVDKEEDGDFGKKDVYPSPLYYAALLGLHGAAQALIEDDEDVNAECGRHKFPILAAIARQEGRLVSLLLEHGADPNTQDRASEDSALLRAADLGNFHILKLLLDQGAKASHQNRSQVTAMHFAARGANIECLAALHHAGSSPNVVDKAGDTPLHWAARTGTPTALEFLIGKGGKSLLETSNYSRQTALHIAVLCNRAAETEVLLDRGANLEARDCGDETPLCIAARKSAEGIVRILLNRGANANAYSNTGRTALHSAFEENDFNIAGMLVEHGAKIYEKEIEGEKALLTAALASDLDMIQLLVEQGVDIDARATDDQTALHIAVQNKDSDTVRFLMEHGARADLAPGADKGQTAMHRFMQQQDPKRVLCSGVTVLHAAIRHGFVSNRREEESQSIHQQIVKDLLDSGADPDTATLTDIDSRDKEVLQMLHEYMEGKRQQRMSTGLEPNTDLEPQNTSGAK